eukprot:TRINITY_DN6625_c0_g1_i1.p1 TRINITY_DN6625_c0_g1~~TRINITY_DN6625_c0_g1_i1.p1  ORF type:complete len:401 (+),score=99.27 TRINITY_DN6625_c0_g1_i1:156-1358(+)
MRLENFLGGLFGGDGKDVKKKAAGVSQQPASPAAGAPQPEVTANGLRNGSGGGAGHSPITASELEAVLKDLATKVGKWDGAGFGLVKTMQEAVRNHGRVDLMTASSGQQVAVKRMPTRWVRTGPKEFREQYPTASEKPWYDFGFVHSLNKLGFPYCCELIGIFRDDTNTFVATSLASEGDLFGWCDTEPRPGPGREVVMKPLVGQIFDAVRWLHALGISHRDISLENILLTYDSDNQLMIKLIDFGMSTLKRRCLKEVRGKQSYQCPEMHKDTEYDSFLADCFAVGVSVFAMAVQDYPWISTKRGQCQLFEYVSSFSFVKLLERRKLRKGNGERLIEVISAPLVELVDGLVTLEPTQRMGLGEACWLNDGSGRASVWTSSWLLGPGTVRFPVALRGQVSM